MRIAVVAVGKVRDVGLRATADEYLRRIRRYVRCDEIEVARSGELVRATPKSALVVALEAGGEALTSRELAERLARWGSRDKGVVGFLLGGADGIPSETSVRAAARLSLSSLTLPHRLARVVLFEQIYRAMTILRGEPYARD